ncbi:MAG: DUF1127 domain-containing protein [Alphaproteobacteria bacterium]
MLRTLPIYMKTIDLLSILETGARAVYAWQERADQRHQLASLDDRMLSDIGLDRMAIATETGKPFWRA